MKTKILVLDIETAPSIAYVWRYFKENISGDQVMKHSEILSFAAKWLGSEQMVYVDTHFWSERYMLETLNRYLDEADIVITHNGNKFDLPRIRARSLVHGLLPPSPYRKIDTYLACKTFMGFDSNSLESIAKVLKCTPKHKHNRKFHGFRLWAQVLAGNPEAWEELQEYNKQDVLTTEEVYLKLRPYIANHPNISTTEEEVVCPKCGGKHVQRRGFYQTNSGKYQRFRCNSCGGWSRTRYTELPVEIRKDLLVNAA